MCGGAATAEHGAGPAREDGCEPPPLDAQRTMADGVDAAMHHVQSARAHPSVDPGSGHAQLDQLRPRYHTPLPRRQLSDDLARGWVRSTAAMYVDLTHPVSMRRFALPVYRRLCRLCAGLTRG
jgi:hypothetical protein